MNLLEKLLKTCFVAAALAAGPSWAQDPAPEFPSKPVKIVVGFQAGGSTDITARVIGEKLQAMWGQSVIIENRPGASSSIAADLVAKAAPDGHTLILGVTGSHGINISLFKKLPYHPLNDFEPIAHATLYPLALVTHPDFAANNVQELFAMAKRQPDKMAYGHTGTGTGAHLGMELLLHEAGIKMNPIPYKGDTPIIVDLMGQQIPVAMTGMQGVLNTYKGGKLKILGITSLKRSKAAPEIPTVAEQGYPGFSAEAWSGFFAPKGTPKPIIDKLAASMIAVMQMPDVIKRMDDLGTPLVAGGPDEFRTFVAAEIKKWAEAVRVAGVSAD